MFRIMYLTIFTQTSFCLKFVVDIESVMENLTCKNLMVRLEKAHTIYNF